MSARHIWCPLSHRCKSVIVSEHSAPIEWWLEVRHHPMSERSAGPVLQRPAALEARFLSVPGFLRTLIKNSLSSNLLVFFCQSCWSSGFVRIKLSSECMNCYLELVHLIIECWIFLLKHSKISLQNLLFLMMDWRISDSPCSRWLPDCAYSTCAVAEVCTDRQLALMNFSIETGILLRGNGKSVHL